jgi:hypothetical protein
MSVREDIITALVDQLKDLVNDPTFDCPPVAEVMRGWPILDELQSESFPLIVVDDNGDQPGPEHGGVARFRTYLNINCIVRANTVPDMVDQVETLANGVRKYLYSAPVLHSQVLSVKVVESPNEGAYSSVADNHLANTMHRIRILWYETVQIVTTSADTDVYGEQWLDGARDKIVGRLTALMATMATGYTPTFTSVHQRHRIPDLVPNAVSVGVTDVRQDHFADSASGASIQYKVTFSVRVHTAFSDEIADDQEVGRLINSIVNDLRSHLNLGDGFRIFDISGADTDATFAESESRGGTFDVVVGLAVRHTQV